MKKITLLLSFLCFFTFFARAEEITYPNDTQLYVFSREMHYKNFDILEPTKTENSDEKFSISTFETESKKTYGFYLAKDGKNVYCDVLNGKNVKITSDMINFDSNELIDDDGYFESKILLNTDKYSQIHLNKNQEFKLLPFRTWQVVNNTIDNFYFDPDFTYKVIYGSSAEVSENGTIKALSSGMTIVEVGYNSLMAFGKIYSAILPQNKAYAIVIVDENFEDNDILPFDCEFDTFYYLDENSFYSFESKDNLKIEILNPYMGDDDFSSKFVTIAENKYKLNLRNGKNILKIAFGNQTIYRVINSKQIIITAENLTNPNKKPTASDVVKINFEGLTVPVMKLAGIYNFSSKISYVNPNGKKVFSTSAQYDFIKNRFIKLTLPSDYDGEDYILNAGKIDVLGFGENFGFHRTVDPNVGVDKKLNASMQNGSYCVLPDIIVNSLEYLVADDDDSGNDGDDGDGVHPKPEPPSNPEEKTITVYFSLRGDTIHGDEKHQGTYPMWIKNQKVTINKGESVKDAFVTAMNSLGLKYEGVDDNYISSITSPNGVKLSEFSNGITSGWVYSINGVVSSRGIDEYILAKNDSVLWFYTDDFQALENNDFFVTVKKQKKEVFKEPEFLDVSQDNKYKKYIYAYAKKLEIDPEGQNFYPEELVTEGEYIQSLYKISGEKFTMMFNLFLNIDSKNPYLNFFTWARYKGLIDKNSFRPDENITRLDAAVLVSKYAKIKGIDLFNYDLYTCDDLKEIPKEALNHVKRALRCGGFELIENKFSPNEKISRGEMTKILYCLIKNKSKHGVK